VNPFSPVARKIVFSKREKSRLVEFFRFFLARQEAIQFSNLYGSFLDQLPIHDIDIGVYVRGMTDKDMTFYALELGDQLGRQAGCPVDVRVLNGAPVSFIYQVLKGELLCEQNPELHAQIFENTVSRYLDMRPLLLHATREAFGNA
jgi:predicted nucleotidyltransferase